jgi:hypothetical protein
MEAEERLRELLAGVRIGESPPEERCESDAAPEDDAGRPPFIIE